MEQKRLKKRDELNVSDINHYLVCHDCCTKRKVKTDTVIEHRLNLSFAGLKSYYRDKQICKKCGAEMDFMYEDYYTHKLISLYK